MQHLVRGGVIQYEARNLAGVQPRWHRHQFTLRQADEFRIRAADRQGGDDLARVESGDVGAEPIHDADQIPAAVKVTDDQLVQRQREMILDPFDPKVIAAAKESGIPDGVITAAQQSPVYRYVKEWELALPLHPEFRTLPMLFYVPPLLPVLNATQENGSQRVETDLFSSLENARVPVRYMSRMLSAGNDEVVIKAYQKMIAVRVYKRAETVGDVTKEEATVALAKAGMTAEEAEAIYHLTSLPTYQERFAVPPYSREGDIEETYDPQQRKAETGFGKRQSPHRGP